MGALKVCVLYLHMYIPTSTYMAHIHHVKWNVQKFLLIIRSVITLELDLRSKISKTYSEQGYGLHAAEFNSIDNDNFLLTFPFDKLGRILNRTL